MHNRRERRMAILTTGMVLALTAALINTQIGYAVTLDGENLGAAGSKIELIEIIRNAEEKASDILGYEYSLDEHISVTTKLYGSAATSENLENAILKNIDGITELYVIEVDGETVGAVSDYTDIDQLLDEILRDYSDRDTISARFTQTISIEFGYVSEKITQDIDEIKTLLDPDNKESEYSLTVETVNYTNSTMEIPFETEYYDDNTVYEGNVVVKAAGTNGVESITHRTVCINGVETSSTIINSVVTKEAVTELVACGTAQRPLTASYNTYIWPTSGTVTSYFGYRSVAVGSSNHQGIDIAGCYEQSICAADGGEVIFADWYSGYGYMIQILHDNGDITYYGHCSSLLVTEGERVYQGQEIALMGSTGVASGIHLHFEIRINDEPVDPLNYLQ